MDRPPNKLSRKERLAASLRENLKRRKIQARALAIEALPSRLREGPGEGLLDEAD